MSKAVLTEGNSILDEIKVAIQAFLDREGEGWAVSQWVVAMGLERMDSDGNVESLAWYCAPKDQADWHTKGLLQNASELHETADIDDD